MNYVYDSLPSLFLSILIVRLVLMLTVELDDETETPIVIGYVDAMLMLAL